MLENKSQKRKKITKNGKDNLITKDIVKVRLHEETSDNDLKIQLLSLISSKLSKTEQQRLIPGPTIYQIDRQDNKDSFLVLQFIKSTESKWPAYLFKDSLFL